MDDEDKWEYSWEEERISPGSEPGLSSWRLAWSWVMNRLVAGMPLAGLPRGALAEWFATAFGVLVLVLVLSQQSVIVAVVIGGIVAVLSAGSHSRIWIFQAWLAGFGGTLLTGMFLGWLAWPLRLLALPVLVSGLLRYTGPDGRPAYRVVRSWVRLRLHDAGWLPAPAGGNPAGDWAPFVRTDDRDPILHYGRIGGPARLIFARPVVAKAARGRLIVRPAYGHQLRPGEWTTEVLELKEGQVAEVRP